MVRDKLGLFIIALICIALSGAGLGLWLVVHPENPVMGFFRRPVSNSGERIVIGPYPLAKDFEVLKDNNAALIICLLNPEIPYEKILIEKEKVLAQQFGIRLEVYPMSSILGHRFGEGYDRNARAAADAALAEPGKIYLHCYLGVHRVRVVENLIKEEGIKTGNYALRAGERTGDARLLDQAQADFEMNKFGSAMEALKKIEILTPKARMLLAWSQYRAGFVGEARTNFEMLVQDSDLLLDAKTGLGYCDLRQSRIGPAIEWFSEVLKERPEDAMALEGTGIALNREGKAEKALVYLEKAHKINPRNTEVSELISSIKKSVKK